MAQTQIPYGDARAVKLFSAGLFAANTQRQTLINRLTGQLPKQAEAEATLRTQSSNSLPVVRCMDLAKTAGDQISIDLINPIGGNPIMGERNAEGLGEKMSFSSMNLFIDQYRKPVSAGGAMTQQRTAHQLRSLARSLAEGYMNRLEDQLSIVHLAGARGSQVDATWAVPLQSHAEFSDIVVNAIKAPTYNRHYVADSANRLIQGGLQLGSIDSADVMTLDIVDGIRALIDDMANPPPPVMIPGDEAGQDDPLYMLLVSPRQYESLKTSSTAFRTFQAQAMARAQQAKMHPLFTGEVGIWNGIVVKKMTKSIRFAISENTKIVTVANRLTATETDQAINGSLTAGYAVDRALLLGGQALVEAYGRNARTGNPHFWSEKEMDHGDKLEVLIGAIGGKSKVRFNISDGNGNMEPTDHGVIAIDTAVKL